MTDNPLESALTGEALDAPVEQAAEPQPAPESAASGPDRAPDGKFKAKASDSQSGPRESPAASPAPQTPAPAAPEPAHAPLSALLDEREKRQAAEKRATELQARWEAAQRDARPPATPESTLQAELYAQRMDMSRMFAESRYGADEVTKLHDWARAKCDADPMFNEQMRSSRNPYEAAMQAFNREMIVEKVSPERLAAFEAWEQAQAQAGALTPQPPQPAAQAPPRSLAQAPGTGLRGNPPPIEEGEGAAFKAAIG